KTAVPVTPSIDSLLYSTDGETCGKSYARNTMFITQAPQGYTMERILWAHQEAYKRGILNPISSSELFIELGEKVHLFQGERFNIKVTTPEDLITLRAQFYYENYKRFAKEELKYGL
ncbi:MAG: 2-C-methyl-D-erythritol 4-phosphate cytidylyltransferase, partial [Ruminococcus sp.]|nr:2-C-methyl-D-erythritol 4-phosphate cytidylyltransferase [Ruminococcus sp.]